jgi:hypothetical protein
MRKFKVFEPKKMVEMSDAELQILASVRGKKISAGEAPLIGKYTDFDGNRSAERAEPASPDLEFAYEWSPSGELIRIYIGGQYHGPLLTWDSSGWRNCYGNGNHGKNAASGGTWASSSSRFYDTIADALANRDYKVGGIIHSRARLTEGQGILDALRVIADSE